MDQDMNVVTAPKTATFQMRINPEVKSRVEAVYASQGLSFTDAVNIFIQQSLNENGLPFLASPENAAFMKAKAMHRLMDEAQRGWDCAEKEDWLTLGEVSAQLGEESKQSILSITATELKQNLSKYLLMAAREDIIISRNGKVVAKLSNPNQDRVDIAQSMFGILPGNSTIEEAHSERLDRV